MKKMKFKIVYKRNYLNFNNMMKKYYKLINWIAKSDWDNNWQ